MANLFIVLFSFTLLLATLTGRIGKYVSILAIQGAMLFFIVVSNFQQTDWFTFVFLAFETLAFKTIAVPYILNYIIKKNDITRERNANIPAFSSLFITSLFLVLGFVLAYIAKKYNPEITTLYFGVAVSTIITAFFFILTRKKLISHVMGYLILENGIFLASLSVTHEMPILVNVGVLLDIFLAVLLLGVFVNQISNEFDDFDIHHLSNLKD